MPSPDLASQPLVTPGRGAGLLDVVRRRFLLSLLVRKELRVRYRGSALGMVWSYVKPAVQIVVFYIAMGQFLQLNKSTPNYIIYLFSGIVLVNFFSEIFGNTTRSITNNTDLVKKIFLPRELFPVASMWVAFVHLLPQLAVLLVASLIAGWRPGLLNLAAIVASILIIGLLALGLGLMFGAFNVLFRDSENLVDLLLMVATWGSPVLYRWQMVRDTVPGWVWDLYQLNPITPAVELAHYGWWVPTRGVNEPGMNPPPVLMPPGWAWWSLLAVVLAIVFIVIGQLVFRRLEGRFAQEL